MPWTCLCWWVHSLWLCSLVMLFHSLSMLEIWCEGISLEGRNKVDYSQWMAKFDFACKGVPQSQCKQIQPITHSSSSLIGPILFSSMMAMSARWAVGIRHTQCIEINYPIQLALVDADWLLVKGGVRHPCNIVIYRKRHRHGRQLSWQPTPAPVQISARKSLALSHHLTATRPSPNSHTVSQCVTTTMAMLVIVTWWYCPDDTLTLTLCHHDNGTVDMMTLSRCVSRSCVLYSWCLSGTCSNLSYLCGWNVS